MASLRSLLVLACIVLLSRDAVCMDDLDMGDMELSGFGFES